MTAPRQKASVRVLSRLGLFALAAASVTSSARAQPGQLDTQIFLPPAAQGSTFTLARPSVPRHLSAEFGLHVNGALGPLVRDDGQGVVPWRAQGELLAALGLFEIMELGVALPATIASVARDPLGANLQRDVEISLADIRLSAKFPLLRGPLALAARTVFTLPSGDAERLLGAESWTATPSLVGTYQLGAVVLAGELGYRFRRRALLGQLEYDDEIALGGGAEWAFSDVLSMIAEAQLRVGVGGQSLRGNEVPMEGAVGVRLPLGASATLDLGASTGVIDGYGAPLGRIFATARWATEKEPCAAGPEDYDGFQDGDFCADPDNDGDGLVDEVDQCPNDAEDRDDFLDHDGCPDTDNDADGVLDAKDLCPTESEDRDGYGDSDGCPEPDNDEDGILDGLDSCPMEPEDKDDFHDEDGCPEPGPEQAAVTVTDSRILISERIYFDFDTDVIRPVSKPLLDEVAEVIRHLSRNRRIRIEGYTDDRGEERYNVDLSYRRARAVVEYLTSRGVPRSRLEFEGYGSKNPVAPNDTAEGRALNRRVEFTILEPRKKSR